LGEVGRLTGKINTPGQLPFGKLHFGPHYQIAGIISLKAFHGECWLCSPTDSETNNACCVLVQTMMLYAVADLDLSVTRAALLQMKSLFVMSGLTHVMPFAARNT